LTKHIKNIKYFCQVLTNNDIRNSTKFSFYSTGMSIDTSSEVLEVNLDPKKYMTTTKQFSPLETVNKKYRI